MYSKKVLSTIHQENSLRVYIKDYFGMHPRATTKIDYVSDHVRRIKSSNADKYGLCDESFANVVGAESFLQMFVEPGAYTQHASRIYEREANSHCFVVKRILNGDAPALSNNVLCISTFNPKTSNGSDSGDNVKIELTDGWYSINVVLENVLTKHLDAGICLLNRSFE